MAEHISRKELKHDRVRETFEHGAEAVLSHTRLASIMFLALILGGSGYLGWRFYTDRQTAQAQVALDDAMKKCSMPLWPPPVSRRFRVNGLFPWQSRRPGR